MVVRTEAFCTNSDSPLVVSPDDLSEDPLVVSSDDLSEDPLVVSPDDLSEDQGGDTIECSSSFGDTSSGFEGDADAGEPEVISVISARANGGGSSKQPRRKKVTTEWRNYVLPVLWRCQWLELRMKELSSQVSKYDRELALIKKQKELKQAVSKANGSMPELMQIHKGHGNSIMKRRKRKRDEENVNTSLYINKHQILSYYHDKQNKGAETGGLLIDDDCGSTVSGSIRGELDTVTLLNSENYDVIYEQLTLKGTLMRIDGLQSRVHLLQDRLSKAHSEGKELALFEDNTPVRVSRKRQHTQKRSFSYTKCRYTKPQKRKNLNSLLKDDGGSALAGRPALPDRETNIYIRDANRNAEERSGECNYSREKAVRMDLLLGTDIFVPYGHIGDLCKENTDEILIDNQAANEACLRFDKTKYLPSGTSSKGRNTYAPVEVKNTYAPAEIDSTSAPAVEPVSPQSKQALKTKKRRKKSFFSTKKQRKEGSKTPAAKEKTDGTSSAAKNKTWSTPCAMTAEKIEGKPSGTMGPGTMTSRSAGKKRQIGNEPADVKKRESGSNSASNKQQNENPSAAAKKQKTENPSSAAKKQQTENPSSTAKKQKTENPSSTAKKQKTENPSSATKKQEAEYPSSTAKKKTENPSATKETENMPLNLKIENEAVLVAVNSRRSQRVRKPKVFAD